LSLLILKIREPHLIPQN